MVPDEVDLTKPILAQGQLKDASLQPVATSSAKPQFRRPQILHLMRLSRKDHPSSKQNRWLLHHAWMIFALLGCVTCAIIAGLCGCYGTCSILIVSALSRTIVAAVPVQRPRGYLGNNEAHDETNMLVATHENANIWYLYSGDRSVVDAILNKTMIVIPDWKMRSIVCLWMQLAHLLQLLAMTYTAAQKGWDGVSLLALLAGEHISRSRYCGPRLAKHWLRVENIESTCHTFEFSGRTSMIAAVHDFSSSNTRSWMDDILITCPRRDGALDRLQTPATFNEKDWTDHDLMSIIITSTIAKRGAKMMEERVRVGTKDEEV